MNYIKIIMLSMLLCGINFSLYSMEEREDGSKVVKSGHLNIPDHIQQEIAIAKEEAKKDLKNPGFLAPLIKLRKDPQNSAYKESLDKALVKFMEGLYPLPSLKEAGLKKVATSFGVLAKEKKFQEIENILTELNDDLRTQLINMRIDEDGNTLLHHYVRASDFRGCRRLLEWKANPNFHNVYYKRPTNEAMVAMNSFSSHGISTLRHLSVKSFLSKINPLIEKRKWKLVGDELEKLPQELRITMINMPQISFKGYSLLMVLLLDFEVDRWYECKDIAPSPKSGLDQWERKENVDYWQPLFQAIYADNITVVDTLIKDLKVASKENKKIQHRYIIYRCIEFALHICTNWEMIFLLAKEVNLNNEYLFHRTVEAGNVSLIKQYLVHNNFTVPIIPANNNDFIIEIIAGNRKNPELFPLLIKAGVISIDQFCKFPNLYYFNGYFGKMTEEDLSILHYIKKSGYKLDLNILYENSGIKLTLLEQALVGSLSQPMFICWLIDEAIEQKIDIKTLLIHLINNQYSNYDGIKEFSKLLYEAIYSFIVIHEIINEHSIKCIKNFLEWEPSLKTLTMKKYESDNPEGETLLMRIMKNNKLSSDQELINLFKE